MNTWIPYEKTIELWLLEYMHQDRKHLAKARSRKKYLQDRKFYTEEIYEELAVLNFHVYPGQEELFAFAKRFCLNLQRIPRKLPNYSDHALFLTQDFHLRQAIEIMHLLNYYPRLIWHKLESHNLLPAGYRYQAEDIEDYVTYFFNYLKMSQTQRDMFFSRIREIPYYRLHCAVYFQTITPQMALTAVGIEGEEKSNVVRIQKIISQVLVRIEESLIEKEIANVQSLTQSLNSLVNSTQKLGWEPERVSPFANTTIVNTPPKENPLTKEDIEAHNAKIRAGEKDISESDPEARKHP